jgi:amino acid transporter, AAT family
VGRGLFERSSGAGGTRYFARTSRSGVPRRAIRLSISVLLFGVLLNYIAPKQLFSWATAVATFAAVWAWAIILVAHCAIAARLDKPRSAHQPIRYASRQPAIMPPSVS